MIRRLDDVDFLAKTLVAGGAVVALFAIVEARTGFNVFNHLSRVVAVPPDRRAMPVRSFERVGHGASCASSGPREHPIALSAAFVMLAPLALYLARRYRQRRWMLCAARARRRLRRDGLAHRDPDVRRRRPRLPLAPPAGDAPPLAGADPRPDRDQASCCRARSGRSSSRSCPPAAWSPSSSRAPGQSGSGRLADLGPGLDEWRGNRCSARDSARVSSTWTRAPERANILDNQWLGTLLEIGRIGLLRLALVLRSRRPAIRRGGEARRLRREAGCSPPLAAASRRSQSAC